MVTALLFLLPEGGENPKEGPRMRVSAVTVLKIKLLPGREWKKQQLSRIILATYESGFSNEPIKAD